MHKASDLSIHVLIEAMTLHIIHTRIVACHKYPSHSGTRFGITGQCLINPFPFVVRCLLWVRAIWGWEHVLWVWLPSQYYGVYEHQCNGHIGSWNGNLLKVIEDGYDNTFANAVRKGRHNNIFSAIFNTGQNLIISMINFRQYESRWRNCM